MTPLAEVVKSLVGLLVAGEWPELGRLVPGSRLSIEDMRVAVADYGRTLAMPPQETFDKLDVVDIAATSQQTVSVRFPLWTVEEGRSDLELVLTITEVADGLWRACVDDLLVP